MTHVARVLAGGVSILAGATLAFAQVQVSPSKPEPAWCGGSYSVTGGLDAKTYHEVAAQSAVPSGTNFGDCVAATYPATPAASVVLDGERTYQITTDAEGKEQRVQLLLPPKP